MHGYKKGENKMNKFRFNNGKYGINNGHVALSWENKGEVIFVDSLNRFLSVEELEEKMKIFPEGHQNSLHGTIISKMLKAYYETELYQEEEIEGDQDTDKVSLYPIFTVYDKDKNEKFIVKRNKDNVLIEGKLIPELQNIAWRPVFDEKLIALIAEAEKQSILEVK